MFFFPNFFHYSLSKTLHTFKKHNNNKSRNEVVVNNYNDPEINPDVHVADRVRVTASGFRSGDSRVQDAFCPRVTCGQF